MEALHPLLLPLVPAKEESLGQVLQSPLLQCVHSPLKAGRILPNFLGHGQWVDRPHLEVLAASFHP
ncbi:hypothetical protein DPMN_062650 [Dreissena polymorpha]|uniref:Uncharacterized protein n=1 Tax=Dreissena polymorpha TaxID=45954 RepID=A0A9D4HIB5_DREPO|nr:hypothetical protein DPMN_062650 [Dreissena polymorpha]